MTHLNFHYEAVMAPGMKRKFENQHVVTACDETPPCCCSELFGPLPNHSVTLAQCVRMCMRVCERRRKEYVVAHWMIESSN